LTFINLFAAICDVFAPCIKEMNMTERSQVQSIALSRRTLIFRSVGGAAGATVLLLAQPRTAAAKMAPASAGYQETPKGDQQCANCTLFQASNNACTLVDGTISPSGWCKFWVKKVK
jgi:hypothetical protein